MRAVEKNTFYKSTNINQAIGVKPNFSDLADGGTNTEIILKGGTDPTYFLISGAIASTPAYGESELIGGYMSLFTSAVTMPTTPSLPQLLLYRTQPSTLINEGSMRPSYVSGNTALAETGQDISVYRTTVGSGDNYYRNETFDGANQSLGSVKMVESLGNGTVELGDAYLTLKHAKDKAVGNSLGNLRGQRKMYALKTYFSDGARVPIEPETDDVEGVWLPKIDNRSGKTAGISKTTIWSKPFYKYKNIKNKISFAEKTPVASDLDSAPLATRGNTIFDEVYATADMNNPFTSDVNNPLMMTTCELSTAKKYSGGNAFRMYHLWDYSDQSAQLQKALGQQALMPSMTRASIYNIPRPHLGLDNAYSGALGWSPAACPTMEMRMNISKLGWNPYLAAQSASGDGPYGYNGCVRYYPSAGAAEPDINTMLGFFRSVTVTWSNYKPKADHVTLDKFLDYGLSRFYQASPTINTEHIVGGVTFMKSPIDAPSDAFTTAVDVNCVEASALPVGPYQDAGSGGDSNILKTSGFAKLTMSTASLAKEFKVATDYWGGGTTLSTRKVKLPTDSWFNMKVVYDAYALNTVDAMQNDIYTGPSTTALERIGVPMRAYFETELDPSGATDTTNIQNVPYLDIYFPAVSGSSAASDENRSEAYSFNGQPTTYPKHMTIWVQNYRWISGTAGSGSVLSSEDTFNCSNNAFYWGDDDAGLKSGAAIEAELFIDDIKFSNWTPEVTNCGVNASISSQQFFTLGAEGVTTPFQEWSDGVGASNYRVRSWAVSGAATSGNFQQIAIPEQMVIGFDNPAQLPTPVPGVSHDYASDAYGYILGSGFNTNLFKNLDKIPATSYAFLSVSGSDINQKKLGGQWFGSHYYNTETETATPTGTTLSGSDINVSYTADTVGGKALGSINFATGTTWDFPSTDAFTQKGLFRFAVSGAAFNGNDAWTKREHISVSTKITGIMGASGIGDALSNNQIKVASTAIFNKYQDDEYIIYRMGADMPSASVSGNANTLGWGVGADEATAWPDVDMTGLNVMRLAEDVSVDEGAKVVTFNVTRTIDGIITSGRPLTQADDGTDLLTEEFLPDLWISPKKYWLTLSWSAQHTSRSYQNFCVVQNVDTDGASNIEPTSGSMMGTTWGEAIFSWDSTLRSTLGSAGLYLRPWNLSTDIQDSTLVMNEDFGYGSYDEATAEGGEISQGTALINNWVELDMMGLASSNTTSPDESITFLLGLANSSNSQTVTVNSDEHSSVGKRPIMYWEYKDTLPTFSAPLKVEPNYNILSGSGVNKVDLYSLDREELNAVKFTWEEQGDDILYRLLYIDTNPIQDKYDGIYFHAPINEIPDAESNAYGKYYTASNRSGTAFENAAKRHITGSSGWAYAGTGTNRGPYTADGWDSPWWGATEATFIAHVIPNITGAGTATKYIISDYYSLYGSMNMNVTKGTGVNADVTPVFTLVSGAGVFSGKEYTLTSDYSFRNDGEHPLFIVVTFDATLPSDCLKMYVNGVLVKKSAGNWVSGRAIYDGTGYSASAKLVVGFNDHSAAGTGYIWNGTIQELIVHKKALHVPTQPNEYILPTTYLPDMSSGTEIKYNARLFLFDYHNIIGSSADSVCSSNEISWEATGI
tara:strand:- start:2554 stop:7401 length:4848 start_codon:yes stop_codon:yes gene_type:complete